MYDQKDKDVAIDAMVAENRWLLKDALLQEENKKHLIQEISLHILIIMRMIMRGFLFVIQDVSLAQELEEAKEVCSS